MDNSERRLGDRILQALELAVEQRDLAVAEHLRLALEEALTRFGSRDKADTRDLPAGIEKVLARLDRLRHEAQGAG